VEATGYLVIGVTIPYMVVPVLIGSKVAGEMILICLTWVMTSMSSVNNKVMIPYVLEKVLAKTIFGFGVITKT